nr:unnamed protein product [Callosobruchus chinensis]
MWIDLESCFENRIRTGAIVNLSVKDPVEFFTRARRSFIYKVKKELQRSLLKVNVIFLAKFIKPSSGEEEIKHFQTKNRVIDHNTDLNIYYNDHIQNNILNKLEEFQERDSGWSLYEIIQLKINFNSYTPINVDLETILEDYKDSNNTGTIKKYQKHIPCSIAYYLLCTYDNSRSKFNLYTGRDCITWFVKQLQQLAIDLNSIFSHEVPMHPLTDQQKLDFHSAQICHICESSFNEEKKVRDHCHFTGAVDLLPVNKEKYISFTKYVDNTSMKFRFLDSFRFMASSLDKLVSYLDNSEKLITKSFYQNNEEFTLLSKKGIFPYDYLDGWKKLEENKLPPIKAFYSKLRNCSIKKAEYTHALNVWNTFKIQNLQEYMELYLKTDVLLLADVFENFRKVCMKAYNLECLKYYTAPGLAYASALKMSRATLELLDDVDKIMFIEKGIRGGISQCSNRYGKANNIYMENEYDPNLPTSYLMYYDINNMYGTALREPLPIGNFTWVENIDFYREDILKTLDDSDTGYILEVDLEYPIHLHEIHKGVIKKDKGITNTSLKRITFEDYHKCLFNQVNLNTNENLIRSKKHEVYTISQRKVALTPYDDKRIVNYVYTDTLPWGYQKNV